MQEAIASDGIKFGDVALPACLKPHFIPHHVHTRWVDSAEALSALLEDFGSLLFREKDLRDRLRLPEPAEELLAIDPGYDRLAIICRPDCVWRDTKLSVLEINSDSPAMMTFADYLERLTQGLFPTLQLRSGRSPQPANRTGLLHRALVECFHQWGGKGTPTIAIVDWNDVKTLHEQHQTASEFRLRGSECIVCDPRELAIEGGRLVAQGRAIDVVYRRVLFMDFINRAHELEPLIRAYREGLVCMANSLRSFVVGNKGVLALLHDPTVLAHLTPSQRAVVANVISPTVLLDAHSLKQVRAERGSWVLKGAFGYGGREVVIGREVGQSAWEDVLRAAGHQTWIAQEFQSPPQYRVPTFDGQSVSFASRYANWNPWMFGGRFAGGMTRTSSSTIVSITQHGALLPSIATEDLHIENPVALQP